MPSSTQKTLLLLGALLLGGAGLFLFLGPGGESAETPQEEAATVDPTASLDHEAPKAQVRLPEAELVADRPPVAGPSTVLWPLIVELDLVKPGYLPEVPSGPPIGSGRTARIAGRIVDGRGGPADARIDFVEGPNTGRVLATDSDGAFGANDLYPGIDIVEVSGPGLIGARREVLLRQDTERLLNMSFARPASIAGEVIDEKGEPLEGATVRVDGHTTQTDEAGAFYFKQVAPGSTLAEITHPGYASQRAILRVMQNTATPLGRIKYVMERGCVLDLVLELGAGEGEPIVYIMPTLTPSERKYPWHLVNPVAISTGKARVSELPAGPVLIRAYRAGAIASPIVQAMSLNPGQEQIAKLRLEPAPTLRGTVTRDGQLVQGARVELVAADPVRASTAHFRESELYLEADVFPQLPPARQVVETDAAGRFLMTRWQQTSAYRMVRATSADGTAWAMAAVGPTDESIDLALEPIEEGGAAIRVALPGRHQAIPVQLIVSGKPRPIFELPPDRDLEVTDLREGTWRAKASWYVEKLLDEGPLEVDPSATVEVRLPEAALLGQDRDTWERAGKEYPLP